MATEVSDCVRMGLVLAAGGVLGGAWMAGALHALADRTRWYPRHADKIVGTSAGSVLAGLGGAGGPPWLLIPGNATNIHHRLIDARGELGLSPALWDRILRRRPPAPPRPAPRPLPPHPAGPRH